MNYIFDLTLYYVQYYNVILSTFEACYNLGSNEEARSRYLSVFVLFYFGSLALYILSAQHNMANKSTLLCIRFLAHVQDYFAKIRRALYADMISIYIPACACVVVNGMLSMTSPNNIKPSSRIIVIQSCTIHIMHV